MCTDKLEHASKLIVGQGSTDSPVEINVGRETRTVTFSANGKHILSGGNEEVQVWRVEDGKQIATMKTNSWVLCFAVSKDGRWIAGGTNWGQVNVWDAETYEQVWSHNEGVSSIHAMDFSPDSIRLVSGTDHWKAIILDVATCKQVQTLGHERAVFAAKYSPQGNRIVTGTNDFVRVWDSNDGGLLVTIKVGVTTCYNSGILWSDNHLFALSDGSKIKQLEASTESVISEWPVPNGDGYPCIALPQHGKFIAYASRRTLAFWDTTAHTQLNLIEHTEDICSVAISPDDQLLAIGGERSNIIIRNLASITVSFARRRLVVYQFHWLLVVYSRASTGRATLDLGREQAA